MLVFVDDELAGVARNIMCGRSVSTTPRRPTAAGWRPAAPRCEAPHASPPRRTCIG
jgi:hypothetical protein